MTSTTQIFSIKTPPRSTTVCLWGVALFIIATMYIFIRAVPEMPALFIATFLPLIVILAIVVISTRKTRFAISHKGLDITGGWVGQSLSWNELDTNNARVVKFSAEPGLKPKWKTVGLAMPGCNAGWFRLYDKSKALLFLTDNEEAVFVPTRKDFSVLLSATDNAAFLQTLKERGGFSN